MTALSDADILSALRDALPEVTAAYLFGSRAEGAECAASDVDLAVLLPEHRDAVGLWETGERIARALGADVDLLDLRAASTVMQWQIVTTGRRLFAKGDEADLYEVFILAEMTSLNEARAPLIADIQREGRVHGG